MPARGVVEFETTNFAPGFDQVGPPHRPGGDGTIRAGWGVVESLNGKFLQLMPGSLRGGKSGTENFFPDGSIVDPSIAPTPIVLMAMERFVPAVGAVPLTPTTRARWARAGTFSGQ